jgi:hypothetical protein
MAEIGGVECPQRRHNKMFLIKKLIRLRYKEGTPIEDHVNEFQGIINQLSSMGITF